MSTRPSSHTPDRCVLAAALAAVLALAGCEQPAPPPPPEPTPSPTPSPTPTPVPTPTPIPSVERKPLSTARLFNGLGVESRLLAVPGDELASVDRREVDAFRVEITVHARLPRASASVEDLRKSDPQLPGVFREFPALIANSSVSPFYEHLYKLKTAQVERDLGRLDQILSRHNFYDCETILNITHPSTGRRAILAIGDMDVNVDGSDGDRNVTVDGSSQFFLPQTSYRWPKQTSRPNPFLAVEEKRLADLSREKAAGKADAARAKEIQAGIDLAKRRIFDLKKWSFLVSETDPFIVLPGFMLREAANPFSPRIGDFAAVIYEGRVYPAILGDAGPSFKLGEASLLLCRELNSRSSALSRPVSNLKVTYLVFPGTAAAEAAPPDLAAWRTRTAELLDELGGVTVDLHEWPNLVKPWPTPTPSPTPTPTPSPTPTPEPTSSSEPEVIAPPFVSPTPGSTPAS